jgi:hypothetical protein
MIFDGYLKFFRRWFILKMHYFINSCNHGKKKFLFSAFFIRYTKYCNLFQRESILSKTNNFKMPNSNAVFLSALRNFFAYALLISNALVLNGNENDTLLSPLTASEFSLQQSAQHNPGVCWQFSAGTLAGKKEHQDPKGLPSYLLIISYRFSPWFSAGGGLGIDVMEHMAVPAFAELKMLLPVKRSYYPYLYFKSGHSFTLNSEKSYNPYRIEHSGGYVLGTGAGILLPGREDFRWFIQAGFRANELKTHSSPWVSGRVIHVYRRLELRIGVFFS